MMATERMRPARLTPPGRVLKRELEARNWSQKDLATIMSRPEQTISEIIRGTKRITPDTAIELSKALGTSAELWMNMEGKYRLRLAQTEAESSNKVNDIDRKGRLYSMFPVNETTKRKWLLPWNDLDELEKNVAEFLGVPSVEEMPEAVANFRVGKGKVVKNPSRIAWVKRVEQIAATQKVKHFHKENLIPLIEELQEYTKKIESVALVPDAFRKVGIRFVILTHLVNTQLDGALIQPANGPIVALTLRYNRIDAFWFSLFHELAHLFREHKGTILDDVSEPDTTIEERQANVTAQEWLIPKKKYKSFIRRTSPYYSEQKVVDFANSIERHPGIIIGRLQFDKEMKYQQLRRYLGKVKPYLENEIQN